MNFGFQTSPQTSSLKWVKIYPVEVSLDPYINDDENHRLQSMLRWCEQSLGMFVEMPAKGITEGWTHMSDPSDTWAFKKHNSWHFVFVFFDDSIKQAFELTWLS